MPNVINIVPNDKAVIAAVLKRALDAVTVASVQDEVSTAAAERSDLPVIVDMSKVEFAPSVALGTLVSLMQDLKFTGRRFMLVGLTRQVRGTLAVTRLDKVFESHPTIDEALRALDQA